VHAWDDRACENPGMTLPIKKRINTEQMIEKTAALFIGKTQITVGAQWGY